MRNVLTLLCALLAIWLLGSCDPTIHEYPDGPEPPAPTFTLHLHLVDSLPHYKTVNTETTRAEVAYGGQPRLRVIVNAYAQTAARDANRTPDHTYIYNVSANEANDYSVQPDIPAGQYRFMVWVDHGDSLSTETPFYDAADFGEITLQRDAAGQYRGNTERRDAFRGTADTVVTRMADEQCLITMVRPLAKYEFVTTDLEEFISRAQAEAKQNSRSTGDETRSVNLSDYRVVFTYPLYVPCSYNMFTDKPADSWAAVSFEGSMEQLSQSEARLGFDYVFVNGSEAMATVGVRIYNKDGVEVASVNALTIPLKRSKLTTVRGKFLTASAGGTIGIDPSFDGAFNIRIN